MLKAALNHAWREGKVPSDDAWRRVVPFREADAARVRYLDRDECRRLVNASPEPLRSIVRGTGDVQCCRPVRVRSELPGGTMWL